MSQKLWQLLNADTVRYSERHWPSFTVCKNFTTTFTAVTDHKPLISLFNPKKGTPAMAANRLARWALTLSQYEYSIEYRKTTDHGNADALSRLPIGDDREFDSKEEKEDTSAVCLINTISQQLKPADHKTLAKESSKDPVLTTVMRYMKDGWPHSMAEEVHHFKKLADSLLTEGGCLLYGARIVIPCRIQSQILTLLHLGHFGINRMKQLARSVVYWQGIDKDIEHLCRSCTSCAEHQNNPPKVPNHPWMLPEKPWSRIHLDHAINFMGSNWLVIVDAYSKYPCIHPTNSVTASATINLLEEDFAHFGYPHSIVTDNAPSFISEEFQSWCKERGITHLTGAPYHPATNGAAERMVQTFKQSLRKSPHSPKKALQDFLMMYRRTLLDSGLSPSELLNGRQIRSRLDALIPSPAHIAQKKQMKGALKSQSDYTWMQKRVFQRVLHVMHCMWGPTEQSNQNGFQLRLLEFLVREQYKSEYTQKDRYGNAMWINFAYAMGLTRTQTQAKKQRTSHKPPQWKHQRMSWNRDPHQLHQLQF